MEQAAEELLETALFRISVEEAARQAELRHKRQICESLQILLRANVILDSRGNYIIQD